MFKKDVLCNRLETFHNLFIFVICKESKRKEEKKPTCIRGEPVDCALRIAHTGTVFFSTIAHSGYCSVLQTNTCQEMSLIKCIKMQYYLLCIFATIAPITSGPFDYAPTDRSLVVNFAVISLSLSLSRFFFFHLLFCLMFDVCCFWLWSICMRTICNNDMYEVQKFSWYFSIFIYVFFFYILIDFLCSQKLVGFHQIINEFIKWRCQCEAYAIFTYFSFFFTFQLIAAIAFVVVIVDDAADDGDLSPSKHKSPDYIADQWWWLL